MPVQSGNTILLGYGNQGAQQSGAAVTLSYDIQAASGSTTLGRAVRAPWQKSRGALRALNASYAAISVEDTANRASWGQAVASRQAVDSAWKPAAKRDGINDAAWGQFGEMANDDRVSAWKKSTPRDDQRTSEWSAYGEMRNEDRGSVWIGSRAIDRAEAGKWRGYMIPTFAPVPYAPPNGMAVNFSVVGGSPMVMQLPGTPLVMTLPLAIQFSAGTYMPHHLGDARREFAAPAAHSVHFNVSKFAMQPVLDTGGTPVFAPSSRDPVRLNPWGVGKRIDKTAVIQWLKYSRPMNPGWGIVVPGGTPAPAPGETITIPILRAYIVVNELLLARVADNTPIVASQLSISFDCDSWLPSFSATIPEASRDAVMPDPSPVELFAYINGSEFRFLVEKVARSRAFAQRSVTISGRGVACELADPYAAMTQHANGSAMTAQQLIDASLEFTAYSQTWNITDWLVPAGALSLYGTPAQVAGSVAEAAGAVLAADWALRDLRMLPRYPVKPWEWDAATPDYVIPSAVTQTESIEWVDKPGYNLVHVSGVQQGVLGRVKITGTAGDKPAPMVTHPLITHADAARQRGISILSDTGRKAMMQISMPVLESTGVIDICRLIEFSDGANTRRGIVRANSVSVNWPTVRQTLTVEAAA